MAQCKKDGCREPEVGGGNKRYCTVHLAAYKAKQAEHQARARDWPTCEHCGSKFSPQAPDGRPNSTDFLCRSCRVAQTAENEAAAAENKKAHELHSATTVDQLRDWIAEYLL